MQHTFLDMPAELQRLFAGDVFDQVMQLQGDVFRDVRGRKTIRVDLACASYFIKQHYGVGWGEVLKNLFSFRLPIVSARTEWRAIQRLDALGIPTTPAVAYGERGLNPVTRRSFIITRDLGDIVSLEDFCRDWPQSPPPLKLKRQLLAEVAHIARILHDNGLNHRDFYICHFCLDKTRLAQGEIRLYLIDLHRVGMRRTIATTARMKDVAALYFSALDIGLSARDGLRFLRQYRGKSLRRIVEEEGPFWRRVCDRAEKLYVKFHGKIPRMFRL